MLSSQQILVASLDYKHLLLKRLQVRLSEQTIRALNGLTEFLCARAQIDEGARERPEQAPGAPYSGDLVEDATLQTKLDCERDAANEYDRRNRHE